MLKPGGRLLLLDFDVTDAGAHHGFQRMFHSHARLSDNSEGRILELMKASGFKEAVQSRRAFAYLWIGAGGLLSRGRIMNLR